VLTSKQYAYAKIGMKQKTLACSLLCRDDMHS
jgi:hypothetical protein